MHTLAFCIRHLPVSGITLAAQAFPPIRTRLPVAQSVCLSLGHPALTGSIDTLGDFTF